MSVQRLDVRVANLDCEHDAAAIERGLRNVPGLVEVKVFPKAAKVRLFYDPEKVTPDGLRERLTALGFPPRDTLEAVGPPKPWRNPKVLTSAASGVLLIVGWLLSLLGLPEIVSLALYIIAIVVGGYYFGREAIEGLIFERRIGIELLMSVAAIVAALLGQAAEAAMLVFLYSISEAAEGYTEEKTRSAIKALMDLAPKTALVRRDGQEVEIPVEEIQVGEIFIVKPGQAVPTDGVVIKGRSSVDQSPVTGESIPVEKSVGDMVFAGSINQEGALEVRATKTFAENTINRIIEMVEEAQERKGQSQKFIERFGARYSPAVLGIGILIALIPPLVFGAPWAVWATRATVFIVAAAPCALVISVPITTVATLGTAARHGVLIKGGIYVEELARIRAVAMDKTGTLTQGEPEVVNVARVKNGHLEKDNEILILAASVEQRSEHPLARAIVRAAKAQGMHIPPVDDFQALPGAGAMGRVNGQRVLLGSPTLFSDALSAHPEIKRQVEVWQEEGKTVVIVGQSDGPDLQPTALLGLIAIRDTLRPNARQAVEALHRVGVEKVIMLTGDNPRSAQAIAREVGIDEVYADLKPEEKALKVRELVSRYGHVAMVGDGVNDAPALAEATVGVAMGAAGTDVALETADVALMGDDLERLAYAIYLARRHQSVVRQNIAFSAIVISALVIGAVAGWFTLPIAVLGHEISEFLVIGSGLRMLRA